MHIAAALSAALFVERTRFGAGLPNEVAQSAAFNPAVSWGLATICSRSARERSHRAARRPCDSRARDACSEMSCSRACYRSIPRSELTFISYSFIRGEHLVGGSSNVLGG
jgi:hypothetical protein